MIDEKINEKETQQLKKIYNHYIDKRKENMNSNKFKVEDIFGDVISKDSVLPEQITKVNKEKKHSESADPAKALGPFDILDLKPVVDISDR